MINKHTVQYSTIDSSWTSNQQQIGNIEFAKGNKERFYFKKMLMKLASHI